MIENLTKEKYNTHQVVNRSASALSVSRDTLNPSLNHKILKERLADIEHYNYRLGVKAAHWPHYVMMNASKHLYKFKFNYALKGFAAYMLYSEVQYYRHMQTQVFLSYQQEGQLSANVLARGAIFGGLCLLI